MRRQVTEYPECHAYTLAERPNLTLTPQATFLISPRCIRSHQDGPSVSAVMSRRWKRKPRSPA
jgi:hypothetical protein